MAQRQGAGPQMAADQPERRYRIQRRPKSRYWEIRDADGELVCVTVYKCGAEEVVRRLDR